MAVAAALARNMAEVAAVLVVEVPAMVIQKAVMVGTVYMKGQQVVDKMVIMLLILLLVRDMAPAVAAAY